MSPNPLADNQQWIYSRGSTVSGWETHSVTPWIWVGWKGLVCRDSATMIVGWSTWSTHKLSQLQITVINCSLYTTTGSNIASTSMNNPYLLHILLIFLHLLLLLLRLVSLQRMGWQKNSKPWLPPAALPERHASRWSLYLALKALISMTIPAMNASWASPRKSIVYRSSSFFFSPASMIDYKSEAPCDEKIMVWVWWWIVTIYVLYAVQGTKPLSKLLWIHDVANGMDNEYYWKKSMPGVQCPCKSWAAELYWWN